MNDETKDVILSIFEAPLEAQLHAVRWGRRSCRLPLWIYGAWPAKSRLCIRIHANATGISSRNAAIDIAA